eukprot:4711602-Amphidinium_carterae.1
MESASPDRRSKRRNEVVLVQEDFRETMVDIGHDVRTVGTQTDITDPVLPAEEKITGDVDMITLARFTNKQLQSWLREQAWSTTGNRRELVVQVVHALSVDGPTEGAASACSHGMVRAGANGTHAWRKCGVCVWQDPLETKQSDKGGRSCGREVIGYTVPDTGCKKSVAGVKCHRSMRKKLKNEFGLKPVAVDLDTGFSSGNGREVRAHRAWKYPCCVQNKVFCIEVAEISESCQPLLPVDAMRQRGCGLDLSEDTATMTPIGVEGIPLAAADTAHPLLQWWEGSDEIKHRFTHEYQIGMSTETSVTECFTERIRTSWTLLGLCVWVRGSESCLVLSARIQVSRGDASPAGEFKFATEDLKDQLNLRGRDKHRLEKKVGVLPPQDARYPLHEAVGQASIVQHVWSTCANVVVLNLASDDVDISVCAQSVRQWQLKRGAHVLVLAPHDHQCWNPDDCAP